MGNLFLCPVFLLHCITCYVSPTFKWETVLVKTEIFYITFLFQLNTVMCGLFMLQLKGVTLSAFYCNTGSLSKDVFERCTTGSESLYQIGIAKCLYTDRDELLENLFKITAQECKKPISKS